MKLQFSIALHLFLGCSSGQDPTRDYNKVICPKLECNSPLGNEKMDEITTDTCYRMQRENVDQTIYARECYDYSRANKKQDITFCGFDAKSGEFAWVDENLHSMEQLRAAVTQDQINAVL